MAVRWHGNGDARRPKLDGPENDIERNQRIEDVARSRE